MSSSIEELSRRLFECPAKGPIPDDLQSDLRMAFNTARGDLMTGDGGASIDTRNHGLDLLLAVAALGAPAARPDADPVTFVEAVDRLRDGTFYEDCDLACARIAVAQRVHDALQRFCDRVEAGEVRSRRTYAKFCGLLGREVKW